MKFCSNCKAELEDSQKFCHKCGSKEFEEATKASSLVSASDNAEIPQNTVKVKTRKAPPQIVNTLIVIIAIVTLVSIFGGNNIFKSKNNIAIGCAKTLISQQLKAPSSAIWHNCKVVDKDKYGKYLVYVEVEATNSFGGYVTNAYFVVVKNVKRNGKFEYNLSFAVQSVEPQYYDIVLEATKNLNSWNEKV